MGINYYPIIFRDKVINFYRNNNLKDTIAIFNVSKKFHI